MSIEPDTVIGRSPNLAGRLFEERMLVVTPKDSMLHRFNEVGTFIWKLIEKPQTVEKVIHQIQEHFDGFDIIKSSQEIMEFLDELEKKKLIEIRE